MSQEQPTKDLPARATEYIDFVVRKMRYRRRVRREVRRELAAHFTDALAECTDENERQALGDELVKEFGDGRMLAALIRRGKKRCRPLWKKAVIRGLQGTGILILLVGLRVAHLNWGSPTISVNYIDWLNEQVRNGRDEALNGKADFDRAVELGTSDWPDVLEESHDHWPGDMDESERKEVAEFLAENAQSLDALREAAAKPYFWLEYEGGQDVPKYGTVAHVIVENMMPSLSDYRKMARRLLAAMMWRAYEGDVSGALNDTILLQRLGRHLEGKGTLIEQMVGVAVEQLSWQAITTMVARADISRDVLLGVQRALEKANTQDTLPVKVSGEKVFWYDYVQRTFTDDGKAGRMLPLGTPLVMTGWRDMLGGFVLGYPDRRETLAMIDGYFERGEDNIAKTPWQLLQEKQRADQSDKDLRKSLMLEILVPAYDRIGENTWRLRARRSAVVTIVALKRWRLDKGKYPGRLDELVTGGYLQQLPDDPYGPGALRYERREDDFVLYSLGADFNDDRGSQNEGDPWGEDEGGDRVFWPVQ